MIVISGCPRSGTSLTMDLMREVFGESQILGKKFPQERNLKYFNKKAPNESDTQFSLRQYIQKKNEKTDPLLTFEESKDMNPNGFWEMLYTVQGCFYRYSDRLNLEKRLKEVGTEEQKICKIVSQGLINSDPRFIDKIIYLNRHPRAVAKSQERLKRNLPTFKNEHGHSFDLNKELKVHTPEMYIQVTLQACRFFLSYPEQSVHFVLYDDLIEHPTETLNGIKDYLNTDKDFTAAIKRINPKLRRSKHEDIKHTLWDMSENIYNLFIQQKYQECLDYFEDNKKEMQKEKMQWHCLRRDMIASHDICEACHKDKNMVKHFITTSEEMGIPWKEEPCLYECGLGLDIEHITVEDSIKNNHWVTLTEEQEV